MATQEIITMTDDLDPTVTEDVQTYTFFDPTTGTKRELELGAESRKKFNDALSRLNRFLAASREVVVAAPAKPKAESNGELAKIREWAKANGYTIGDRGRIKAEIVKAYQTAMVMGPGEQVDDEPVKLVELSDEAPESEDAPKTVEPIVEPASMTSEEVLAAMAELNAEGSQISFEDLKAKVDSTPASE